MKQLEVEVNHMLPLVLFSPIPISTPGWGEVMLADMRTLGVLPKNNKTDQSKELEAEYRVKSKTTTPSI